MWTKIVKLKYVIKYYRGTRQYVMLYYKIYKTKSVGIM